VKIIFIIIALLYALLPTDLLPDMLIGWGWIDDLILLGIVLRYVLTGKAPSFFNQFRFRPRPTDFHRNSSHQQQSPPRDEAANAYAHMTPHEILGVSPSATMDEIRAAYRKLAGQYHPDKVQHLGVEFQQLAEIKFKIIQEAYQKLTTGR
jgi:hypothetical protein